MAELSRGGFFLGLSKHPVYRPYKDYFLSGLLKSRWILLFSLPKKALKQLCPKNSNPQRFKPSGDGGRSLFDFL
ncbi:MAG: hypothetical protein MUQ52_12035, partial [Pirellulales bacterium]|nr:hypothetical protein [Pirellulales bacterium]